MLGGIEVGKAANLVALDWAMNLRPVIARGKIVKSGQWQKNW